MHEYREKYIKQIFFVVILREINEALERLVRLNKVFGLISVEDDLVRSSLPYLCQAVGVSIRLHLVNSVFLILARLLESLLQLFVCTHLYLMRIQG